MWDCSLCLNSDEYLLTSRFCSKCKRIKHLLSIYGDDVYLTLEEVLVRNSNQQKNKIETTIKPKIERTLRSKDKEIIKEIKDNK
tara:strand:+ start:1526 stop:1777 length:252 start_codon:yes stop_codon:yes gene_type:complete